VTIGQETGWVPEPDKMLWRREKLSPPRGNRTLAIQPVAELARLAYNTIIYLYPFTI
jgi:hypothetical protein